MLATLKNLGDGELRTALKVLAARDRDVEVELLLHLGELDQRRVFLQWGYGSLWDFARRELQWSEKTTSRRIIVARLSRKFESIATYLRDGRVNVCVLAVLARQLNEDNHIDVLKRASGMSRREAEALAVVLGGKPLERRKDVIRLVGSAPAAPVMQPPLPEATLAGVKHDVAAKETASASVNAATEVPAARALPPAAETVAPAPTPPAARVHRVSFDANEQLVADMKRLQEIFGNAELNAVLLRACETLLDRVDPLRRHSRRQKLMATRQARAAASGIGLKQTITKGSARVKIVKHRQPLRVRDEASARDGAQCSFVAKDGVRCAERSYLHIDHIRPFAMGGSSTDADNNRVLCAAHNLYRSQPRK